MLEVDGALERERERNTDVIKTQISFLILRCLQYVCVR